jgi:hypothetical protein
MAELRPALDAALRDHLFGGLLQGRWEGDVLRLWGPGARGSVVYEAGRLIGRADLGLPASLLRPQIEEKLASALREVAG